MQNNPSNILAARQECKKQFLLGNKRNLIATVVTQTIFSLVSMSVPFLMMVTIEAIEYQDINRVKIAGVFVLFVIVFYAIFGNLQKVFRNRYIKHGLSRFKHYIFSNILSKSIRSFSSESSGRVINAFSNDLGSIELNYLSGTIEMIQQIIMLIVAIVAMFYLNVILALCVMVSCIIPITMSLIIGKPLVNKEKTTSDEGESFVDQIKDLLNGFILIKSFKAEKEVLSLFDKKNFSLEEAKQERRDVNDSVTLASKLSSILVISVVFTIGLFLAFQGVISIGAIIAFVELAHYVTGPIETILPLWNNRKAAIVLVEKVADVVCNTEEVDGKVLINREKHQIILKDLSFSYGDKAVLKNINQVFEEGKSYALVGASGCGKSTLVQLIMGYYEKYDGQILIGNVALNDINLDSLYEVISVIQQNVFLFDSTIESNITMFKEFDQSKFEKAVSLAGLSQLIDEKGSDYNGGEGGRNLSGGEKQRISIARALIRETPIIIMDEATASLDNQTAFDVEMAILKLENLTKIIVTHKLNESILKKYDQIIVMYDGEIKEIGGFEQLMSEKNYFYSLYNVSAENPKVIT